MMILGFLHSNLHANLHFQPVLFFCSERYYIVPLQYLCGKCIVKADRKCLRKALKSQIKTLTLIQQLSRRSSAGNELVPLG